MDLPNEIILHILKSLEKSDLKSTRLVSKTWATFAAELLFDQAYVSAHPENLDVFKAITRHPLLSKCVKTLKYDGVDFVETLTEERYFQDLWRQTRSEFAAAVREKSWSGPIPDPEINTWVNLVATKSLDASRGGKHYQSVRGKCKDYRFINCGYHKYKWYAALQSAQFHGGDFFETLVGGLQKLRNLACITVDSKWPSHGQVLDDPLKICLKRSSGSPMARNWEVFHACPRDWEWMPRGEPGTKNRATDGAIHYWTMTNALIRSQRKIKSLDLDNGCSWGIPPYVFDRSQPNSPSFYGLDIVAFSDLTVLKLGIAAYGDEKTPELFSNMDGLRLLLGSLGHLEVLGLDLPIDPDDNPVFYNYNQVFPPEGHWSQLTTLSLQNFASGAADFVALLALRAPNLDDLELGMVQLLSGTWESVIECMMQSTHLTVLNIIPYTQFYHRGGAEFLRENVYDHCCEIEKYVEYGGRHPSLRPDQPDSAARNYITEDLKPFYKVPSST